MSKVIPRIFTGGLNLLLSETVCFDSASGLIISLPTQIETTNQPGADIVFDFKFSYGGMITGEVKSAIEGNKITISIDNFGTQGIYSTLLKPLTFKFGNVPIALYFAGQAMEFKDDTTHRMVHLTVSIYQGDLK